MAAALVVAVAGWWPRIVSPPAPTAERAALVASGARQIEWAATEDPAASGASGET